MRQKSVALAVAFSVSGFFVACGTGAIQAGAPAQQVQNSDDDNGFTGIPDGGASTPGTVATTTGTTTGTTHGTTAGTTGGTTTGTTRGTTTGMGTTGTTTHGSHSSTGTTTGGGTVAGSTTGGTTASLTTRGGGSSSTGGMSTTTTTGGMGTTTTTGGASTGTTTTAGGTGVTTTTGGTTTGGATGSGSASEAGSVANVAFVPQSATWETLAGNQILVTLWSEPNACASIMAGQQPTGAHMSFDLLAYDGKTAIVPSTGVYTAEPPSFKATAAGFYVAARFDVLDGACKSTIAASQGVASSGSLTVTAANAADMSASFAFIFGGSDATSGSFDAINCGPTTALTCPKPQN